MIANPRMVEMADREALENARLHRCDYWVVEYSGALLAVPALAFQAQLGASLLQHVRVLSIATPVWYQTSKSPMRQHFTLFALCAIPFALLLLLLADYWDKWRGR